jgi:hypothetical protein
MDISIPIYIFQGILFIDLKRKKTPPWPLVPVMSLGEILF